MERIQPTESSNPVLDISRAAVAAVWYLYATSCPLWCATWKMGEEPPAEGRSVLWTMGPPAAPRHRCRCRSRLAVPPLLATAG